MTNLHLSIATTDYDHFRDFRTGAVQAQGIDHTWSVLSHHEIFARFTAGREWDVSELSFAKFTAQVTRDEPDIIGLPVICSRLFRFASFYVNRNSALEQVRAGAHLAFVPHSIPTAMNDASGPDSGAGRAAAVNRRRSSARCRAARCPRVPLPGRRAAAAASPASGDPCAG